MVKILGIVSSPRRSGNTATLTKIALEEATRMGAETDIVYLVDYKVEACDSCLFFASKQKMLYRG
jgi:multimeric flavodoxin WrbA